MQNASSVTWCRGRSLSDASLSSSALPIQNVPAGMNAIPSGQRGPGAITCTASLPNASGPLARTAWTPTVARIARLRASSGNSVPPAGFVSGGLAAVVPVVAFVSGSVGFVAGWLGGVGAEEAGGGLKKILSNVHNSTQIVSQIARATDEQLAAGQTVVTAINTTAAQAKQVATATAEQAKSVQSIVQATSHMRKIAQEVSKAMNEQGRAARELIKAAQNTSAASAQVRKASAEQAKAANQITQATEYMRRGAASTSDWSTHCQSGFAISGAPRPLQTVAATITRRPTPSRTGPNRCCGAHPNPGFVRGGAVR